MSKNIKEKFCIFLYFIIIFIFLFPSSNVFAETLKENGETYTYYTEDDGTDGPEVNTITYMLTGYGGEKLGAGIKGKELTDIDKKYGWRWYEKDGVKYVVLAGATHEYLTSKNKSDQLYNFDKFKFTHIHYFRYFDTITFRFEDANYDPNLYVGIILDSCGVSTFPQHWWTKKSYSQINVLDVYFGENGDKKGTEDYKNAQDITGKKILVTMNGKFSKKANVKKKVIGELALSVLTKFFIKVGDFNERLIGMSFNNVRYIKPSVYTKDYAKGLSELKVADIGEKTDAKFLSEHDVSNVRQNRSGAVEIIYTVDSGVPIVQHDIYSMVSQDLDLFDIDFITPSNPNVNKFWRIVRNIVVVCSRSVLYFSAVGFITILIWQGIKFVSSIYRDSPLGAAEAREIMQNCIVTIMRLVGIFLIIALTVYLYKYLREKILGEYTSKYLIRINIKDTYSFNTNIIGSIRLMTMSTNVLQSSFWAFIYWLVTLFNLFYYVLMFLRMLAVGFLTIIAPITAISALFETENNVVENNNILRFRGWIRIFMIIVWVPMILLIILRLMQRF